MPFYYLLLGHLLGDFTLQTNKIAERKSGNTKWILLHAIVVTICMLLLSVPFGYLTMSLVLANGALHYFIDLCKTRMIIKNQIFALVFFLLDQLLHILIIFLISILSTRVEYFMPGNEIVKLLIVLVLVSSFSSVLTQYIIRLCFSKNSSSFYNEKEKAAGNISRLLFFLALYLSLYVDILFLIAIPVFWALVIIYYKFKLKWQMGSGYFVLRLFMDFIIPLIGFSLLQI